MDKKVPVIDICRFSYAYGRENPQVLKDVSMRIQAGECHVISGPTGCGKSTLLLSVKNLLPTGRREGKIVASGTIGLVLQNPETQILCDTIGGEVAFGLENHCVDPVNMPSMVARALSRVGLEKPLSEDPGHLSMGQKYRLILASFLSMAPSAFLLDEPCAQLDSQGISDLMAVISDLKKKGISFLICDHHPERLKEVCDHFWSISKDGKVFQGILQKNLPSPNPRIPASDHQREDVIVAEDFSGGVGQGKPIFSGLTFCIQKGDRVVVEGANGSGKSTLIRCIAGLEKNIQGHISVFGGKPSPQKNRNRMGILFQNPDRQLFEDTVLEEVMFPLRQKGLPAKKALEKAETVIGQLGISGLLNLSPHKLSYGQKHLTAFASAACLCPDVLILDDPFAGLDREFQKTVISHLLMMNNIHATTIVITTHHAEIKGFPASNVIQLGKGGGDA